MVILHVLAPAAAGGLERVVLTLAGGLQGGGHEVHVAAVVDERDRRWDGFAALARRGATAHAVVVRRRGYRSERAQVAALCRRVHADVLHTHGYRPDCVDAGVARRAAIPVVSTVHGFTGGGWKDRAYERLQLLALRRCDAVVAVSRPLGRALERSGVARDRIHIIPNAWDGATPLPRAAARQALGLSSSAFVVGWVGRLSAEKGPDVLVEALARLRDQPVVASIIGDGPLAGSLAARARVLEVDAHIRWHGSVPDAGRLFAAFDAFALSSRTEGTPIVLFEAMAARVPIVAATVGGVGEVIGPGTARLIAPDDPAALAEAVREVRRFPEAARARAALAGVRLECEFRSEPWVERYESVYERVRDRRRAAVIC